MMLLFALALLSTLSNADVIITEIVDPKDNHLCRFVELYGDAGTTISKELWLMRWTNGQSSFTATSGISLKGQTFGPHGFLVFCNSNSCSNLHCDQISSVSGTPAGSNGDDQIGLVEGDPANGAFTIIDFFGVIGEDGTGTSHDFENGRAERKAGAIAKQVWDVNDWNVVSGGVNFADADPRAWIGAASTTDAPTDPATLAPTGTDPATVAPTDLVDAVSTTDPPYFSNTTPKVVDAVSTTDPPKLLATTIPMVTIASISTEEPLQPAATPTEFPSPSPTSKPTNSPTNLPTSSQKIVNNGSTTEINQSTVNKATIIGIGFAVCWVCLIFCLCFGKCSLMCVKRKSDDDILEMTAGEKFDSEIMLHSDDPDILSHSELDDKMDGEEPKSTVISGASAEKKELGANSWKRCPTKPGKFLTITQDVQPSQENEILDRTYTSILRDYTAV